MALIEDVPERGLAVRALYWAARRKLGRVVAPLRVLAHHLVITGGYGAMETALERATRVPVRYKLLASVRAATMIGCPF